MVFRAIICVVLLSIVIESGGVSIPNLSGCAVEYLSRHNLINTTAESETIDEDCDAIISSEITKFYNEIQNLITSGVNVDNLDNFNFVAHEKCIMERLEHFNISHLYLKGIAYAKLNKVHRSDHSFNIKMTSEQILLLYALQVCEPRSFFARHEKNIFSMNMRTTKQQDYCLLNHLNENSVGASYQFAEETESIADLQPHICDDIIRNFIRKYYNVIDRTRSFSIFGLNPAKAMECRMSHDKNLIDHMILLTIFSRLQFSSEEIELEKLRFFEIARDSAKIFFHCISLYDWFVNKVAQYYYYHYYVKVQNARLQFIISNRNRIISIWFFS